MRTGQPGQQATGGDGGEAQQAKAGSDVGASPGSAMVHPADTCLTVLMGRVIPIQVY